MTSVLMTADAVGGVWTYALELADALAPHGISVTLATMGPPLSADQREQVARSAVVDLHESHYALEWMADPWRDVERAGQWLLDVEGQVRPDVVHLNGYVHGQLPWRAPNVVVAHSCVVSWWKAVHGVEAPPDWDEYRRRVACGLAAAGAVVAPTAAVLDDVQCCYGVAGGVVIPNGLRWRWGRARQKELIVMGCGRLWDEAKNLAMLDEVASRLDWPVVIAGDDARPGKAAWAHGAAELLGWLSFDELAQWLLRAAVFVHPARYEPFGLAALKAALAGCALVLGDIASLHEVWVDAALFVDPDDPDMLVATVQQLVGDADLLRTMGDRARVRAQQFSAERMAAGYLDSYALLPAGVGGTR